MVVGARAVAHRVVVCDTGAVAVRACVVAGVADRVRASVIVSGVTGSVVLVLSDTVAMARVVRVLLVGVAVAMAVPTVASMATVAVAWAAVARAAVTVAVATVAIAVATVAIAAMAVTTVAVVVVASGGRRQVFTNNTARQSGDSSLEVGRAIGESVIDLVLVSIGSLHEDFKPTAHDRGRARQVDQDVVLNVGLVGRSDTLLSDCCTVSGGLLDSCNSLDPAALRVLEWVRATVLVKLSQRSPLLAHVVALLCFISSVLEHLGVVGGVCSFALGDDVTVLSEDGLVGRSGLVSGAKRSASDVGEPLHGGGLAWRLSELVEPLVDRSVIARCGYRVGERCLSLDASGVAGSELGLL